MADRRLDRHAFRSRRRTLGLTQVQLADKAGVSISYIKLIERGGTQPSRPYLLVLSGALACTVDDLLETDAGGVTDGAAGAA